MLVRFAAVVYLTRNWWKLFCLFTFMWLSIHYTQSAKSIQLMKEACWEGCCYVLRYLQFFASFVIRPAFHSADFQNCRSLQVIRCINMEFVYKSSFFFCLFCFICCRPVGIYSTAILYSFSLALCLSLFLSALRFFLSLTSVCEHSSMICYLTPL